MEKTIVVSGANRGLGARIARMHLEKGDTVHMIVRRENETIARFREQYPSTARVHMGDVSKTERIAGALEEIRHATAHVDILYNVAGIFREKDNCGLDKMDVDDALEEYNINALGPLRVLKGLDAVLDANTRIINITSQAGSCAETEEWGKYAYSMSKAALNFATKLYCREKKRGRNILCVCPGWMQTDMGGAMATLDPEISAEAIIRLAEHMDTLDPDWLFFKYDGRKVLW